MSVVLIISAPSGSGKYTLARKLVESDAKLDFSTSVTTRAPRPGDEVGKSYRFVTEEEFLAMRDSGELLEWAQVFGNYYGTSNAVLDLAREHGHDLLLDIDVQGARLLMERLPEAVTVFILPPSRRELEKRLRKRSSDSVEVIERRLSEAAEEVEKYADYNYVLVNDRLEETLGQLRSILVAERCRQRRMASRIESILETFEVGTKI